MNVYVVKFLSIDDIGCSINIFDKLELAYACALDSALLVLKEADDTELVIDTIENHINNKRYHEALCTYDNWMANEDSDRVSIEVDVYEVEKFYKVLNGSSFASSVKETDRKEVPCIHCGRMNDVGISECWHCGNVPF